jgi:hypothetical protein
MRGSRKEASIPEVRNHAAVRGDDVTTRDTSLHGESRDDRERRTIDGVVRTQRGRPQDISAEVLRRGHEPTDVQVRGIAYAVAGLIVSLAISVAFVGSVFAFLRAHHGAPALSRLERAELVPPAPRLQIASEVDRVAIETAARDRLQAYAWIEEEPGRARIPIDRAMQLLAQHGWPDSEALGATSPLPASERVSRPTATAPTRDQPPLPQHQRAPLNPPFEEPP